MKTCKKINFGRSLFLAVLTLRGILGITKNSCVFWRRLFLEKFYLTSRALKRAKICPKRTSFGPPNVLNKLLSRNPNFTRRCEVNKFNLVSLL